MGMNRLSFRYIFLAVMRQLIFYPLLVILFYSNVAFADFSIIYQREEFLQVITGRQLKRPLIELNVSDTGGINGSALTTPLRGTWKWQDGYFCRDLFWGNRDLGYNCQQVSLKDNKIRFTSDQGRGDYADFTLR